MALLTVYINLFLEITTALPCGRAGIKLLIDFTLKTVWKQALPFEIWISSKDYEYLWGAGIEPFKFQTLIIII